MDEWTRSELLRILKGPQKVEDEIMSFDDLALGARFIYASSKAKNPQVWIKLENGGCGIIAEYDSTLIKERWAGQSVCSAKEESSEKLMVKFVA